MSELVDPSEIETIVGMRRHLRTHIGRAVSETKTVYILHSKDCIAECEDLRDCEFSIALDQGINEDEWLTNMDKAVSLDIDQDGYLIPKQYKMLIYPS